MKFAIYIDSSLLIGTIGCLSWSRRGYSNWYRFSDEQVNLLKVKNSVDLEKEITEDPVVFMYEIVE